VAFEAGSCVPVLKLAKIRLQRGRGKRLRSFLKRTAGPQLP
jgi:hypothetical protein